MSKLKELFELLDKENKLYEELLDLSNEKKRVIVTNQIKVLEQITAKEQGFIKTVVQLEKMRTKVVDELSASYGVSHLEQLSDLEPYLSGADQRSLLRLKEGLSGTIKKLTEVNTLNGELINQSIEFIDFSYELYRNMQSSGSIYDESATENKLEKKRNLFDAKA
jgi:flagellar biosynthesis/type III secretory pathway chaperone